MQACPPSPRAWTNSRPDLGSLSEPRRSFPFLAPAVCRQVDAPPRKEETESIGRQGGAGNGREPRHRRSNRSNLRARGRKGARERRRSSLSPVRTDIERATGKAMQVVADVTKFNENATMRQQVEQELGPIDVLVANAGGVYTMPSPLEQTARRAGTLLSTAI